MNKQSLLQKIYKHCYIEQIKGLFSCTPDPHRATEYATKYRDTLAGHLVRWPVFDNIIVILIALNTVWIAVDADYNNADIIFNAETQYVVIENFFCAVFVLEMAIRLVALKYRRTALRDKTFLFDIMIVFLSVIEIWFLPIIILIDGTVKANNLGFMSTFRILRLLKLTRMARLMRNLPELVTLIKGMWQAGRSVLSTLVLLFFITYMFAVIFTQQLSSLNDVIWPTDIQNNLAAVNAERYSSCLQSMLSLFSHGTLLDDLYIVLVELRDGPGPSYSMMWIMVFYVLISAFTLLNMLIGILCEVISATTLAEKELKNISEARQALSNIYKVTNTSNSRLLTQREFQSVLNYTEVQEALFKLGLHKGDIGTLIDLIFYNNENSSDDDLLDNTSSTNDLLLECRNIHKTFNLDKKSENDVQLSRVKIIQIFQKAYRYLKESIRRLFRQSEPIKSIDPYNKFNYPERQKSSGRNKKISFDENHTVMNSNNEQIKSNRNEKETIMDTVINLSSRPETGIENRQETFALSPVSYKSLGNVKQNTNFSDLFKTEDLNKIMKSVDTKERKNIYNRFKYNTSYYENKNSNLHDEQFKFADADEIIIEQLSRGISRNKGIYYKYYENLNNESFLYNLKSKKKLNDREQVIFSFDTYKPSKIISKRTHKSLNKYTLNTLHQNTKNLLSSEKKNTSHQIMSHKFFKYSTDYRYDKNLKKNSVSNFRFISQRSCRNPSYENLYDFNKCNVESFYTNFIQDSNEDMYIGINQGLTHENEYTINLKKKYTCNLDSELFVDENCEKIYNTKKNKKNNQCSESESVNKVYNGSSISNDINLFNFADEVSEIYSEYPSENSQLHFTASEIDKSLPKTLTISSSLTESQKIKQLNEFNNSGNLDTKNTDDNDLLNLEENLVYYNDNFSSVLKPISVKALLRSAVFESREKSLEVERLKSLGKISENILRPPNHLKLLTPKKKNFFCRKENIGALLSRRQEVELLTINNLAKCMILDPKRVYKEMNYLKRMLSTESQNSKLNFCDETKKTVTLQSVKNKCKLKTKPKQVKATSPQLDINFIPKKNNSPCNKIHEQIYFENTYRDKKLENFPSSQKLSLINYNITGVVENEDTNNIPYIVRVLSSKVLYNIIKKELIHNNNLNYSMFCHSKDSLDSKKNCYSRNIFVPQNDFRSPTEHSNSRSEELKEKKNYQKVKYIDTTKKDKINENLVSLQNLSPKLSISQENKRIPTNTNILQSRNNLECYTEYREKYQNINSIAKTKYKSLKREYIKELDFDYRACTKHIYSNINSRDILSDINRRKHSKEQISNNNKEFFLSQTPIQISTEILDDEDQLNDEKVQLGIFDKRVDLSSCPNNDLSNDSKNIYMELSGVERESEGRKLSDSSHQANISLPDLDNDVLYNCSLKSDMDDHIQLEEYFISSTKNDKVYDQNSTLMNNLTNKYLDSEDYEIQAIDKKNLEDLLTSKVSNNEQIYRQKSNTKKEVEENLSNTKYDTLGNDGHKQDNLLIDKITQSRQNKLKDTMNMKNISTQNSALIKHKDNLHDSLLITNQISNKNNNELFGIEIINDYIHSCREKISNSERWSAIKVLTSVYDVVKENSYQYNIDKSTETSDTSDLSSQINEESEVNTKKCTNNSHPFAFRKSNCWTKHNWNHSNDLLGSDNTNSASLKSIYSKPTFASKNISLMPHKYVKNKYNQSEDQFSIGNDNCYNSNRKFTRSRHLKQGRRSMINIKYNSDKVRSRFRLCSFQQLNKYHDIDLLKLKTPKISSHIYKNNIYNKCQKKIDQDDIFLTKDKFSKSKKQFRSSNQCIGKVNKETNNPRCFQSLLLKKKQRSNSCQYNKRDNNINYISNFNEIKSNKNLLLIDNIGKSSKQLLDKEYTFIPSYSDIEANRDSQDFIKKLKYDTYNDFLAKQYSLYKEVHFAENSLEDLKTIETRNNRSINIEGRTSYYDKSTSKQLSYLPKFVDVSVINEDKALSNNQSSPSLVQNLKNFKGNFDDSNNDNLKEIRHSLNQILCSERKSINEDIFASSSLECVAVNPTDNFHNSVTLSTDKKQSEGNINNYQEISELNKVTIKSTEQITNLNIDQQKKNINEEKSNELISSKPKKLIDSENVKTKELNETINDISKNKDRSQSKNSIKDISEVIKIKKSEFPKIFIPKNNLFDHSNSVISQNTNSELLDEKMIKQSENQSSIRFCEIYPSQPRRKLDDVNCLFQQPDKKLLKKISQGYEKLEKKKDDIWIDIIKDYKSNPENPIFSLLFPKDLYSNLRLYESSSSDFDTDEVILEETLRSYKVLKKYAQYVLKLRNEYRKQNNKPEKYSSKLGKNITEQNEDCLSSPRKKFIIKRSKSSEILSENKDFYTPSLFNNCSQHIPQDNIHATINNRLDIDHVEDRPCSIEIKKVLYKSHKAKNPNSLLQRKKLRLKYSINNQITEKQTENNINLASENHNFIPYKNQYLKEKIDISNSEDIVFNLTSIKTKNIVEKYKILPNRLNIFKRIHSPKYITKDIDYLSEKLNTFLTKKQKEYMNMKQKNLNRTTHVKNNNTVIEIGNSLDTDNNNESSNIDSSSKNSDYLYNNDFIVPFRQYAPPMYSQNTSCWDRDVSSLRAILYGVHPYQLCKNPNLPSDVQNISAKKYFGKILGPLFRRNTLESVAKAKEYYKLQTDDNEIVVDHYSKANSVNATTFYKIDSSSDTSSEDSEKEVTFVNPYLIDKSWAKNVEKEALKYIEQYDWNEDTMSILESTCATWQNTKIPDLFSIRCSDIKNLEFNNVNDMTNKSRQLYSCLKTPEKQKFPVRDSLICKQKKDYSQFEESCNSSEIFENLSNESYVQKYVSLTPSLFHKKNNFNILEIDSPVVIHNEFESNSSPIIDSKSEDMLNTNSTLNDSMGEQKIPVKSILSNINGDDSTYHSPKKNSSSFKIKNISSTRGSMNLLSIYRSIKSTASSYKLDNLSNNNSSYKKINDNNDHNDSNEFTIPKNATSYKSNIDNNEINSISRNNQTFDDLSSKLNKPYLSRVLSEDSSLDVHDKSIRETPKNVIEKCSETKNIQPNCGSFASFFDVEDEISDDGHTSIDILLNDSLELEHNIPILIKPSTTRVNNSVDDNLILSINDINVPINNSETELYSYRTDFENIPITNVYNDTLLLFDQSNLSSYEYNSSNSDLANSTKSIHINNYNNELSSLGIDSSNYVTDHIREKPYLSSKDYVDEQLLSQINKPITRNSNIYDKKKSSKQKSKAKSLNNQQKLNNMLNYGQVDYHKESLENSKLFIEESTGRTSDSLKNENILSKNIVTNQNKTDIPEKYAIDIHKKILNSQKNTFNCTEDKNEYKYNKDKFIEENTYVSDKSCNMKSDKNIKGNNILSPLVSHLDTNNNYERNEQETKLPNLRSKRRDSMEQQQVARKQHINELVDQYRSQGFSAINDIEGKKSGVLFNIILSASKFLQLRNKDKEVNRINIEENEKNSEVSVNMEKSNTDIPKLKLKKRNLSNKTNTNLINIKKCLKDKPDLKIEKIRDISKTQINSHIKKQPNSITLKTVKKPLVLQKLSSKHSTQSCFKERNISNKNTSYKKKNFKNKKTRIALPVCTDLSMLTVDTNVTTSPNNTKRFIIHQEFLNGLRQNNKVINYSTVIKYIIPEKLDLDYAENNHRSASLLGEIIHVECELDSPTF